MLFDIFMSLRPSRRLVLGLRCAALPPAAPHQSQHQQRHQHHHFIAPAPEAETPLQAARPDVPPKAAAAAAATTAATAATANNSSNNQQQQQEHQQHQQQQPQQQQQANSPQPIANKHSSTRGDPGGIEPETFWIWGGLGGFGGRSACLLVPVLSGRGVCR